MTARDELLAELRRVYNEGNLIIFAGEGVSRAGGLPGRKELAERLRGRAAREATKPGTIEEIDDYIQKGQLVAAFSAIKEAMGQGPFGDEISRELDDKDREPPELAMAIAGLRPRLRGVLTTNLDRFLEKAFRGQWHSTAKPTSDIAQSREYIFKLHGTLRERDTWVFTRERHEHIMFASPAHRDAFDALYRACVILFIGHDPSDGGLDLTLGAIRALAREQPPRHFAILPGPLQPHRRRLLDDAGVRLIECESHDLGEAEALRILRDLAEPQGDGAATQIAKRAARAAAGAAKAPAERPRVLITGPYFGLSRQTSEQVEVLWKEGLSAESRLRIDDLLRDGSVEQAQIGAIVRHDLIVDLSPWRAFARWKSDGLRELEPFRRDDDGAGLVLFAFSEEAKAGTPEEALAALSQRLEDLWARVEAHLGDRLASGVGLSGVDGLPAWWEALIARCAELDLVVDFPPPPAEGRVVRRVDRHDGTGADLTEREYLRALRVVAGQVMLAGEAGTRALQDVWMEVEIAPRGQRADDDDRRREAHESGDDDLAAELRARQNALVRMKAGSILSAEGILRLARRVFIWGEAGTGKSTLLQWLACRTAQTLQIGSGERLPVWIPAPALQPRDLSSLPDQLAELALKQVRLPVDRTSAVYAALRARIAGGDAHLLLDSLDEQDAARAVLHRLSPELYLHLASRPTQSLRGDYTEVELRGLTPSGAQRFLREYFGDERWIPSLLRDLRELPDGPRWTRTPVLLSLAAGLYRRRGQLPGSIVDLYGEVIGVTPDGDVEAGAAPERGLERPLDRVVRESGMDRQSVVEELSRLARGMLAPEAGTIGVTFREGNLPYEMRGPLRRSGLFTGTEPLKFAHLTFGEYFAARCPLDLSAARARWRATADLSHEEGLEVLPMAHAIQGEPALKAALEDAEARDTPDHRMLRLLLRSLRYGGSGVRAFCEAQAAKVLELVLARMQMPSGRFGDAERSLLDAAEPALLVVAPLLKVGLGGTAGYRGLLEPLLDVHGEAGTEAHVIAWTLGLRAPGRRSSRWWVTIFRVARALVRLGLGVSDVLRLTEGSELSERDDAVRILARFDAYRPLLFPLTWDWSSHVREDALRALSNDPRALPWMRERLWDDEGRLRMTAVSGLNLDHATLDMVEAACLDDRHPFVQAVAIQALAPHPQRWDALRPMIAHRRYDVATPAIKALAQDPASRRAILERLTSEVEKPWSVEIIDASLSALRGEPGLDDLIRKALEKETVYLDETTLRELAKLSEWQGPVLALAEAGNPAAIRALADLGDYRYLFRRLLRHESERTREACIDALASDEASWDLLAEQLGDKHTADRAVKALKNVPAYRVKIEELFVKLTREIDKVDPGSGLRANIVTALAGNDASRPLIMSALKDPSSNVRVAAIKALCGLPTARGHIRRCLHDTDWSVRVAALDAFADEPEVRGKLRSLLVADDRALRLAAFHIMVDDAEHRTEMRALVKSRVQGRISAIQPLSRDPESRSLLCALFNDASPREQITLIEVLRGDPDLKRMARAKLSEELISKPYWWPDLVEGYIKLLGEDPESRPLFKELFHGQESIAAVVAPVLSDEPDAKPRFLELLRSEHAAVRAAAVEAIRPDADVVPILRALLQTEKHEIVQAAAATALATDEASLALLRASATHRSDKVRTAAFRALSQHPEEHELLWKRLALEDKDELRAEIAEFLAVQPAVAEDARRLMRSRLSDPSSRVRIAATKALAPTPGPPGVPLADVPSLRLALHLAGVHTDRLSDEDYTLQTRLLEYVTRPTPFILEDDLVLGEAVLGWLCVRLAWASSDGALSNGRVFGELKEMPRTLLGSAPVLIRVAMDSSQLPRERWLHPTHNVIEAWQVAKQLRSRTSPTILLACADVDFADLVPPELAPGKASWGPTFFGFRLARPDTPETPGAGG